jgi:D-tyrosyl-tRNA(Tyr) deacylase
MRAVIQRVSQASVTVNGQVVASIGRGLVVLLGIEQADKDSDRAWMSEKIPNLRIFEDAAGKMNLSVIDLAMQKQLGDVPPGILVVPNFTVAGGARKGRRPSFDNAMKPELSEAEFGRVSEAVRTAAGSGVVVQTGVFRADMKVELVNDGPVTIWLDSKS